MKLEVCLGQPPIMCLYETLLVAYRQLCEKKYGQSFVNLITLNLIQ